MSSGNIENSGNTTKVIVVSCLVGGLIGIGLFLHYRFKQSQPSAKPDDGDNPEHPSVELATKKQKEQVSSPSLKETKPFKKPSKDLKDLKDLKKRPVKKSIVDTTSQSVPHGDEFPLRLGSKGKRVERLRIWLMRNYEWTGIISDEFDESTEKLLQRYLKKTQLDEATYHKLKMGQDLYRKP